ncbi:MAG TPA: hypothetical protein EYP35_05625, partial [Desulfobacterales bacterium]|nr:hypothetical protein [Desulfobacterales bacterium]
MKLQTKFFITILLVLIIFSISIGTMQYIFMSKNADAEISQFRETQTTAVKQTLKNYVDIAYETIETNYRNRQDKQWLEKQYGPRLINVIEMAQGIISENQKLVSDGTISVQEAQRRSANTISRLRYNNGSGYIWI